MEESKTMVLDLSGCKYFQEMHRRIKEAFDFPDYYGENWGAFYDLMCTDCTADKIIIRGVSTVSESLSRQVQMMNNTLVAVKKDRDKYDSPFGYRFED